MSDEHSTSLAVEVGSQLHSWRTRVLNVLLVIVSVVAAPAVINHVIEAMGNPGGGAQALAYMAPYLLIVALAVFRRIDVRVRAWGLLVVGYGWAAMAMASQ